MFGCALTLLLAACDSTPQTNLPGATASTATSDVTSDIDAALHDFGSALAVSLGDKGTRLTVHGQLESGILGEHEVLLSDVRPALTSAISNRDGGSARAAAQTLRTIVSASRRIDITMPVHYDDWDPKAYAPLVAIDLASVRESREDVYTAYGADGSETTLSAAVAPDVPTIVVGLNEVTDEAGLIRPKYRVPAGTNLAQDHLNSLLKGAGLDVVSLSGSTQNVMEEPCDFHDIDCGGGGGGTPPIREGTHTEALDQIAIYNDHEGWGVEPAEIWTTVFCPGSTQPVFKTRIGDPEPEDVLLYAGLDSNYQYDFQERSHDLSSECIEYFSLNKSAFGPYCVHEYYEDDGGGTEVISFSITDPNTGVTTTVSDTRPIEPSEMGRVTFLFDDPLTTQRYTSDFRIQMQ